MDILFFITLLKYSECGRSQHLDEASDIWYMLVLCSKYVNYLNERQQQQQKSKEMVPASRPWPVGGVPAVSGPGRRTADRQCRSGPASHSAEPPLVQSRGGEFGPTCQTHRTLPGRTATSAFILGIKQIFMEVDAACAYLNHLRVIEPPAQKGLDQRKHLLQHHNNLAESLEWNYAGILWQEVHPSREEMGQLTGFCDGEGPGLDAASEPSPCLLTSRVVKRLASIPMMCRMDCLFVGLG